MADSGGEGMDRDGYGDEISLIELVNLFLRDRRLILGTTLAVVLLAVTVRLAFPPTYTTSASFMPQSANVQASRLAGLAAQFGFSLPTAEAGQSPRFYAGLLKTEYLLQEVVSTTYEVGGSDEGDEARRDDLVGFFRVKGDTRPERVERAIDRLRDRMRVETDVEAGLVRFSVTTRWPELSASAASRILELVHEFDLETRQSQARAERRFIEERLEESRRDLKRAEDEMETFLERNRRFENPQLRFEHERLQRELSLQQQLFTTLSESYEKSKIEEVRNTPVVTVVEVPTVPARRDPRGLLPTAAVGLVVGGIVGVTLALGRHFVREVRRRRTGDWEEFVRLRQEARDDLGGAVRRVRRALAREDGVQ